MLFQKSWLCNALLLLSSVSVVFGQTILMDPPTKVIADSEIRTYNSTDHGPVFLEQKSTGELVLYKGTPESPSDLIWTNGLNGSYGEYYTRLGPDGEFATIEGNEQNKGKKAWIGVAGNSDMMDNSYYFVLNADASVSVLHNAPPDGEVIWTSTLTSAPTMTEADPPTIAPTVILTTPPPEPTEPTPTVLLDPPNKFINNEEILTYDSADGPVYLEQKSTGELALYKGTPESPLELIWTNNFSGEYGSYFTKLGANGEFVTIEGTQDVKGKRAWIGFEGTDDVDNDYYFILNLDNSVSIVKRPIDGKKEETIWTSTLTLSPSLSPSITSSAVPTAVPVVVPTPPTTGGEPVPDVDEPTMAPSEEEGVEPTEDPAGPGGEPTVDPVASPAVLLTPPEKIILSGERREAVTDDGSVFLEQKSTGELMVFRNDDTTPVWSSGFMGDYGEYYSRLAPTGNLFTQEGNPDAKGKRTWSTNTVGVEDNTYYFVLNPDDSVSIMKNYGGEDETEIWTSMMTSSPTLSPTAKPTTAAGVTMKSLNSFLFGIMSVVLLGAWIM